MTEIIKYRTDEDGGSVVIRTEDGGVASIDWNGNNYSTTYYQLRDTNKEVDWVKLAEGKAYCKDWKGKESVDKEMIADALAWMHCGDYEFSKTLNK